MEQSSEEVPPSIQVLQLQETIMDIPISVQIIVMKDSLWAHVRDSRVSASVDPLCMAIPTKFDSIPLSTPLLRSDDDEFGAGMGQRIAKRLNIQCFMSSQLKDPHAEVVPVVEQLIVQAYNQATSPLA